MSANGNSKKEIEKSAQSSKEKTSMPEEELTERAALIRLKKLIPSMKGNKTACSDKILEHSESYIKKLTQEISECKLILGALESSDEDDSPPKKIKYNEVLAPKKEAEMVCIKEEIIDSDEEIIPKKKSKK